MYRSLLPWLYTKVADWDKKEYLKAKIRAAAVKNVLIEVIDGRASYTEIEQPSIAVINHAETVYAIRRD